MVALVFDVALPPRRNSHAGYGRLSGPSGPMPVESVRIGTEIVGLVASVQLTVTFRNHGRGPVEATYILPLPERAALSAMRIRTASAVIDAVLRERADARAEYDAALHRGRGAALLEQERDDVFTVQVGSIAPGERVDVELSLLMHLGYSDGQLYFRFPLVVGPHDIPGAALDGEQVGSGTALDTDLVPDASRISPPRAEHGGTPSIGLVIDLSVARSFTFTEIGCTYPLEHREADAGALRVAVRRGERLDRDFVLRLQTEPHDTLATALSTATEGDGTYGAFALTALPPTRGGAAGVPRDVVVVLDNSSAMSGWRLVAARRIAARIVDMLTAEDRFTVLTVGGAVGHPGGPELSLVSATDRNRFHAVEHLVSVRPVGGCQLHEALDAATGLLQHAGRARLLLVIGACQVGNGEQIVGSVVPQLRGTRVHAIGIGAVVNRALLQHLVAAGRGQFLVAETDDALDTVAPQLRRLLGPPALSNLGLSADGMQIAPDSLSPARPPDLFPGAAVVITGRWRGNPAGSLTLSGTEPDGSRWSERVTAVPVRGRTIATLWARARLADLQEQYLTCPVERVAELERAIVATSIGYSVLTRMTAFVATVKDSQPATGELERVVQIVEHPADWSEPEPGLSAYAIEYARRMTPTEPGTGQARPTQVPPARAEAPAIRGAYAQQGPAFPASPPQSPVPPAPGAGYPAPPVAAGYPAPPPARSGGGSHRGIIAGVGVAIVAAGIAIGGVAVTMSQKPDAATSAAPNATTATPPTVGSESTEDDRTGATLTVSLEPDGSGTTIQARASGIAAGTPVRLVAVGADGTRDVIAETIIVDDETTWTERTDIAPTDVRTVRIEGTDGVAYVTAEF